jgi:urea transporter
MPWLGRLGFVVLMVMLAAMVGLLVAVAVRDGQAGVGVAAAVGVVLAATVAIMLRARRHRSGRAR